MKKIFNSEQSGRSMVEMLGVLAIIGVLSIGGISGYSKAMAKFRINKTLDQISMLVMNIRSLYSSSVSYSGLTSAIAINLGIIPSDMLPSGASQAAATSIVNAYQGEVKISAANTGGNDRSFTIEYAGLTREACVAIATADWGSQAGSGLVSIAIAPGANTLSNNLKQAGSYASAITVDNLPLNLAAAAGFCTNVGDTGNAVKWEYY